MNVIRRRKDGTPWYVQCRECERIFDLYDEDDAAEAAYGHDCEA